MIRRSVVFGLFLSIGVAVALFQLKYKVSEQERQLAKASKEIYKTEEAIHILQAEWSYLNEPGRLQMLAEKHLQLTSSDTAQLVSYKDIGDICKQPEGADFTGVMPVKY